MFNQDGELITDMNNFQQEFLNYFQTIMSTTEIVQPIQLDILQNGPLVSEEQGLALYAPVTDEEVKAVIFSIPDDKSPGPDGFTSGFFRDTWAIIHKEVCYAIKDFFRHGKILREINNTMIILVPKIPCPKVVADYRPIACCNVIYKAITKILTLRMQSVMESLIDPAHGAFVKGRSIVDNVLVCQGLVRGYSRSDGIPRCLMKLDLRKAYDLLDWRFLEAILKGLKFPDQFIQLVM